jgi:phosphatidylglycerophosphate synthase
MPVGMSVFLYYSPLFFSLLGYLALFFLVGIFIWSKISKKRRDGAAARLRTRRTEMGKDAAGRNPSVGSREADTET